MLSPPLSHIQEKDIFPLRDSFFEGIPVKIPNNYVPLLTEEYGDESISNADYNGYVHRFRNES